MRAFVAMLAAGGGYVLLIGILIGMSTASGRPTIELTAEFGEPTVFAVEPASALVADCEPAPIS